MIDDDCKCIAIERAQHALNYRWRIDENELPVECFGGPLFFFFLIPSVITIFSFRYKKIIKSSQWSIWELMFNN